MNWEQTIKYIRTIPDFKDLVEKAYLDEDIQLNVDRFSNSDEFKETLLILKKNGLADNMNLLDLGAGNGIAAVSFALRGYNVTAVEPDPGDSVGYGAIQILKRKNSINNLTVISSFGENIPLEDKSFDIVYIRQALHHAENLRMLLSEVSRLLKKGGIMLAVREHVIYNHRDKQIFLKDHPLHEYYLGENAFTLKEYSSAIKKAGLSLVCILKYFDSIINYFPLTSFQLMEMEKKRLDIINNGIIKYHLDAFRLLKPLVSYMYRLKLGKLFDEKNIPGRCYSFIALKN